MPTCRVRVYNPMAWDDAKALAELAQSAPVTGQSLSLLLALGERLRDAGGDAVPFLKRVQKEHPADFWANLILGNTMLRLTPLEAGGYYRAALANDDGGDELVAWATLWGSGRRWMGRSLTTKGSSFQSPMPRAHSNPRLRVETEPTGRTIDCSGNLARPQAYGQAHACNLGNALRVKGRLDEAYDHYRQVIELDPKNAGQKFANRCLASAGARARSAARLAEGARCRPYRA